LGGLKGFSEDTDIFFVNAMAAFADMRMFLNRCQRSHSHLHNPLGVPHTAVALYLLSRPVYNIIIILLQGVERPSGAFAR
jgi:hypothetical protein